MCSETPSLFPYFSMIFLSLNLLFFSLSLLIQHTPTHSHFSFVMPYTVSLFSHFYSLFPYPSCSQSVCLVLSFSLLSLSLPGSFFHLLVSCICETDILADYTDSPPLLQLFVFALPHTTSNLPFNYNFPLVYSPTFSSSVS